MLQVQNIEKYYGSKNNVTQALDRVSFDVEAGEFLAIMGASGSGKTTLLNCISTIDTISAGKILLDGVSVADLSETELARFRRERLGFVFQDFNLLDTLTIEENIGLALSLNHQDPGTVQSRVRDIAQKLGITDILPKFPYQVSGGQKQRIAIARAILKDAPILLLDEATSALDTQSEKLIQSALGDLMQGRTTFVIAHRLSTILDADIICVIKNGRIIEQGTDAELVALGGEYKKLRDIQFKTSKN